MTSPAPITAAPARPTPPLRLVQPSAQIFATPTPITWRDLPKPDGDRYIAAGTNLFAAGATFCHLLDDGDAPEALALDVPCLGSEEAGGGEIPVSVLRTALAQVSDDFFLAGGYVPDGARHARLVFLRTFASEVVR
ncbi:hypothetical protein FRAHR75_770012 [Frankia sp. Hr75.2]|nr:hypothetical protein FRAHR75_770012 [Frankia sp. Hr75.2]